jgi:hypothetical protein
MEAAAGEAALQKRLDNLQNELRRLQEEGASKEAIREKKKALKMGHSSLRELKMNHHVFGLVLPDTPPAFLSDTPPAASQAGAAVGGDGTGGGGGGGGEAAESAMPAETGGDAGGEDGSESPARTPQEVDVVAKQAAHMVRIQRLKYIRKRASARNSTIEGKGCVFTAAAAPGNDATAPTSYPPAERQERTAGAVVSATTNESASGTTPLKPKIKPVRAGVLCREDQGGMSSTPEHGPHRARIHKNHNRQREIQKLKSDIFDLAQAPKGRSGDIVKSSSPFYSATALSLTPPLLPSATVTDHEGTADRLEELFSKQNLRDCFSLLDVNGDGLHLSISPPSFFPPLCLSSLSLSLPHPNSCPSYLTVGASGLTPCLLTPVY